MLQINNLSKSYGKKQVLNNLNLHIKKGTINGVVGANGAGKTTLYNCITKFWSYDGSIQFANNVNIGYMPAEMYFYDNMKGSEFLEFSLIARKQKIDKQKIEYFNSLFKLPLNNTYVCEYSTGMKKKLSLMSILLQKNDLFLLDEPFNGLDLSGVLLLKKILVKLKEQGKTVFVSSHIISSLTEIANSIAYLNDGKIVKEYLFDEFDQIENDIISTHNLDIITQINI